MNNVNDFAQHVKTLPKSGGSLKTAGNNYLCTLVNMLLVVSYVRYVPV